MKIRVLVTGANGQLGKTISDLSSSYSESLEFICLNKSQLDISDKDGVHKFFTENSFDYCINCAAYTNVDLAQKEYETAININAIGAKHLALSCKENQVVLIHMSTDYVFNGNQTRPYTESDETNPINSYGKSKLLGENYIKESTSDYFIIRTSWLYSQFNNNFVKTIYNKLSNDEKLNIVTSQKGTPTSCIDLAKFILFLVENQIKSFGIYHFSASGNTTWFGLATHIAEYVNKASNVKPIAHYDTLAERPLYSVLDNQKVIRLTKTDQPNWRKSVNIVLNALSISSDSKH
ncbi:dTDP-4-dehydrorhamnose reductase [Psychroserpens sp. SPM9]|uniref:dTDP-4-dehydrorhamnose reductase n=1 Tax=Psychroserpens sp. SPM9 TaxID=2975598 RepID=UPI0021A46BD8|nr:dTDP-4-dehydrorhamnose reductase [Psychroserpens sp. SPM9]MDG5491095.1 dTDP-4-dehydrorhamnose reductase [Psychroserpens sp. SPM9]